MANEKRLVWDADVMAFLCKRCNEIYPEEPCEPSDCLMLEELDKCPTVDAVEVVRCKDCKMFCRNYAHLRKHCGLTGAIVEDDDFCSYGERREG